MPKPEGATPATTRWALEEEIRHLYSDKPLRRPGTKMPPIEPTPNDES